MPLDSSINQSYPLFVDADISCGCFISIFFLFHVCYVSVYVYGIMSFIMNIDEMEMEWNGRVKGGRDIGIFFDFDFLFSFRVNID